MKTIRDRISKATGFFFRGLSFDRSFVRLQKGGQLDLKVMIKILAGICDYLEDNEKSKKK